MYLLISQSSPLKPIAHLHEYDDAFVTEHVAPFLQGTREQGALFSWRTRQFILKVFLFKNIFFYKKTENATYFTVVAIKSSRTLAQIHRAIVGASTTILAGFAGA